MIALYHGTNQAFGTIDLQRGLPNKDFGRGFYLTAPSREWALFVRANRRDYVDADDHNRDNRYDLVVGPIANDKLSLQFRLFDKGIISLDDFVDGLKFRQVYMQYSFHTNRAVELLELGEVKDVG